VATEMEAVPRDIRDLVPETAMDQVPRALERAVVNLHLTMDTLEVATAEEMEVETAVDPANITTVDWLPIPSTDLDPREDLKAVLNLDRMMDPAQATEVPRDTRVAVAPREDPIPRDIRDPDRMTDLREAVMVPREVPNPALNLDRSPDLTTVKMEVATEEVMAMEVVMAEELVAIMPTEEMMTMTVTPTR